MGVTEGPWRLKAILFIFLMVTLLYGTQYYFVQAQEMEALSDPSLSIQENITEAGTREYSQDIGSDITSFFGGIYEGFTFQSLDGTPAWASFFLTLFTSGLLISGVYITYTFVYEVIKALPFT